MLTWFLILGKIQGSDHYWWRHGPPAAPPPIKYISPSWKDQRVSTKGKIVGRGSINPLPFVSRWGVDLRVRPRVNNVFRSDAIDINNH